MHEHNRGTVAGEPVSNRLPIELELPGLHMSSLSP
jgi:hypothetical protein